VESHLYVIHVQFLIVFKVVSVIFFKVISLLLSYETEKLSNTFKILR